MKRLFWILTISLLMLSAMDATAQRWKLQRYEADIYLGAVSFHGDIGLANSPLANMFNGIRPSIGITPRFFIRRNLAVSLDLGYIMYGGADDDNEEHGRVYTFNSNAFQHFARLEYYLLGQSAGRGGVAIYNRRGMINNFNKLNVYLFAGAGGILSKSTVKDQDGEEPIDNPGYSNEMHYGAAFPVGGGLKMALNPRWSAGLELGYQFTTTDWLDGYKPTFSHYNDSYYLLTIKAIYMIRNDRHGKPIFKSYRR